MTHDHECHGAPAVEAGPDLGSLCEYYRWFMNVKS